MFTLDSTAVDEIIKTASRYGYVNFIAVLTMASRVFVMDQTFKEAYLSKNSELVREAAKKNYSSLLQKKEFHLSVDIYEESEFPFAPNHRVNGILFYLPEGIDHFVEDAHLVFANDAFSLRDPYGLEIRLPMVEKL